jgi:hypothetical protein
LIVVRVGFNDLDNKCLSFLNSKNKALWVFQTNFKVVCGRSK